jgi:SAM-dependent methyltransferase
VRHCPICHCDKAATLFAAARFDPSRLDQFAFASRKLPEYMHHQLQWCRDCDLVYASPIPDMPEIEAAYLNAAFDSQAEAACAARTYGRLVDRLLPYLPDLRGALDIGTGDGVFLRELLSRGFQEVTGIEPSAAPIAAAGPDVGPLIRQGLFEPGLFPSESFSLVTCFQTIEHVEAPLALCREAFRLLKPGGACCLVGHNRRAFSARLLGRRSPIYDIEHFQLFSPGSFRLLLSRSGFSSIEVKPYWNRYPLSYWARLFPFPAGLKRLLLKALAASGIGNVSVALPAGNLLAIGFKPHCIKPNCAALADDRAQ